VSYVSPGTDVAKVTGVSVITVATQKGGVGKTTLTLGLASYWASCGKSVAFIDMDPQSNASRGVTCAREGTPLSTLLGEALTDPRRTVADSEWSMFAGEVFGLTGGVEMGELVVPLATTIGGSKALGRLLDQARQEFDYIIVDTPPNTGTLTTAGVIAADFVVTITNLSRWSAEGAARTSRLVTQLQDFGETDAKFIGAVINRPGANRVVSVQVRKDFEGTNIPVLGEIPERVCVQEGEYLSEPAALTNKDIKAAFATIAKNIERSIRVVSKKQVKKRAAARA